MAGQTAPRWGGATHVGRIRTVNEDNYLARDDVGLWAVADGMGGHQGGEVASQLACDALGRAYAERTVDGLIDAIEQANAAVFEAGAADPDLSGMGTTLVALASIHEDEEELLAVANVGDSRVYRLSHSEFDQLTEDHSLVADLVREGSLSPEEAAVHPQRNIVTRVLGVDDRVPIDALTIEPVAGDRYLLCSDGLFNEVPEPQIVAVLRRLDDPAEAADELVRLAVEAGGRDNVTVVVVDVVDDAGRAEAASSGVTADDPPHIAGEPTAPPAANGGDTADATALDARTSTPVATLDRAEHHPTPRARRVTWRVLLFSFIVLALIGGAFATIQWYGRSTYFVGYDDDDHVAIYKGRPGGVLWVDPQLEEATALERAQVPEDTTDDLDAGKEQSSLADARTYVDRLEDRVDELSDEADDATDTDDTTTTTERSTTTTSAPRRTTTTAP